MVRVVQKQIIFYFLTYWLVIQAKKPSGKRQQVVWKLECELGVVSDPDCPVDGGWSPWSPWSSCQGPCDDAGQYKRTRQCNNPPPSKEGLACTGLDQQIQTCYITNCTVHDYRSLVHGDSARTQAFHQLEIVPAIMERCLQKECPYEAIENALSADNTWQINPEALWNALQCVKHRMGCSVVGEWGAWGQWSTCGARCGLGLRWRLRRCDTPPPSDVHLICRGTPLQADACEGDQCAIERRGASGSWSDWAKWSTCSEKCGPGVRRRRRICLETQTLQASGTWGTHCRGQHDQLEVCESKYCTLDGGWSGWSPWGPCSSTCGSGRRSRTRSCTRPIPAGRGKRCPGSPTEFGSCYLIPCEVYSNTVAVFNGESCLNYNFENRRSTFFHYYIRFMPLSPHGILVRRGALHNPLVRLSLQKWHVCLDVSGSAGSCGLPRICSHSIIEPAVWHTALITVTSEGAFLRLDDSPAAIKSGFPCDPELPNEKMNICVGEKFHGEIQQIALNFMSLNIFLQKDRVNKTAFFPSSASNIAYEKANFEEAFLTLSNLQYLRIPCFSNQDDWKLELALITKGESGSILFLKDESNNWFHVSLQNMRIKLKWALRQFRSESMSSVDSWPGQWLAITLSKKKETNMIEASTNSGERFHVVFEEKGVGKVRKLYKYKNNHKKNIQKKSNITTRPFTICTDEFFVGGVPNDVKEKILEEFTPFTGTIAFINVNNVLLDLHEYSVESYKDNKIQVSSRTASISGSYHETAWGDSNRLNLTCFHSKTSFSSNSAHWLYLDTSINYVQKQKSLQSMDNGRILHLVATEKNDLRGFYTCRSHTNRRTINVVTYAVLGRIEDKFKGPDLTTAVAWFTTLTLVIGSLVWLFIECIHDVRTGYGFFRDAHFTPEEEAEAVCKYIDQRINLVGSKSAIKMAKGKAWRRAHKVSSPSNFAAQEPQGMDQESRVQHEESTPSEPDELPALPEVKTSSELTHNIYRCELNYISSPPHGSLTSPRAKISTSSSFEMKSPRVLCSRLLLTKRVLSPKESSVRNVRSPPRNKRNLLTIKSSSYVNYSPAQKIIEKFKQLKKEDP
ncbi:hypothetical protein K1T71_000455 [Dendrolimus kikuchii]|uniref:Uncharacterized protein n=1 Tax=Dendrolimus kikuchii TaxID=765133 RepID=A0ACC1DK97_9NEOP|nr:hypothetical protein K1T71_000455 [Dendrolimus kikuchii]